MLIQLHLPASRLGRKKETGSPDPQSLTSLTRTPVVNAMVRVTELYPFRTYDLKASFWTVTEPHISLPVNDRLKTVFYLLTTQSHKHIKKDDFKNDY